MTRAKPIQQPNEILRYMNKLILLPLAAAVLADLDERGDALRPVSTRHVAEALTLIARR